VCVCDFGNFKQVAEERRFVFGEHKESERKIGGTPSFLKWRRHVHVHVHVNPFTSSEKEL
jgi:hypothetical protein